MNSAKIHNQSKEFLDIEVGKDNFHMECADIDKEEKKSLMVFYALDGDTVHEFFFRRISEENSCKNVINQFNKLTQGMQKIRLVGISPLDKKKNNLTKDAVPENFKSPSYLINWTFIRLETSKGCEAYFENDCDSENYWGGLFPQK